MNFSLRKAVKSDCRAILELIKELATFEKEPEAVIVTVEDLERDGFGENPLFKVIVAETETEIVGMAFYYYRYSTWKGKTIHLEDLIVKQKARGKNVGSALYKELLKEAYKQNVKRVEWVVLDWNTPARDFYIKSGAKILDGWETVQMDEQGLKNFIINNS